MKIIFEVKNGPILMEPKVFKDNRGYFFESFSEPYFNTYLRDTKFVQDNQSKSEYGVLRGLHFQKPPYAQAKLVRVVNGAVFDVAVDIRKDSPTYKQWWGAYLSEENQRQFFIPQGFAHGFISLRDNTVFQYKCDNVYNKESEGAIAWDDEEINIPWEQWINLDEVIISEKDSKNKELSKIDNPFTYDEA